MSAAAERVELVERLWAAIRDCKRKGECVVTLNFETVRTAATLLEAIDRLTNPAEPTKEIEQRANDVVPVRSVVLPLVLRRTPDDVTGRRIVRVV